MLTHTELSALHRSHRGERMLSAYIDGSTPDPAEQRTWQLHVQRAIKDLRTWLDESPRSEREDFDRCVSVLEQRLAEFDPTVGAPGWVAFIAPDGVIDAQPVCVPVATQVVWSNGPCVAPYLAALADAQLAIVAVVDAKKADLYRYQFGGIAHVETLRSRGLDEAGSSESDTSQGGTHSGSRGATGHDAAQQSLLESRDKMIDAAARHALDLADTTGWVFIGGISRVASALEDAIATSASGRVAQIDGLDVHASEADIAGAARAAATLMREAQSLHRVNEIVERCESGGLGTLGEVGTRNALKAESVHELLITRGYAEAHAPEAEEAIRTAFDQSALVEEVSGHAAEVLDAQGGIAAKLRFHAPGTGREGPTVDSRAGKRPFRPKRRRNLPAQP